jgi:triphosphoribosyl-dephospho-CoA synthetase
LAETYGILDYKEVRPSVVATLAVGLPESSRIKRKYSGINLTLEQMLLAMLVDGVNISIWQRGGGKKSRKPMSIFKKLTEKDKPKDELMSFRSPEEYEKWMKRKREIWNG